MRAYSRHRFPQLLCAAALLLATAGAAVGQTAATYCTVEAANKTDGDPLHPIEVITRLQPEIDRNDWPAVTRRLADDFRASDTAMPLPVRQRLQRELDALAARARELHEAGTLADAQKRGAGLDQARFEIAPSFDTAGAFELFKIDPASFILIDASLPVSAAKEICYRARAAQRALTLFGKEGRDRALSALGYYITLWDNYNTQGYSQYPWELYVNGKVSLDEGSLLPPRSQWVIAHPAIAVQTVWPRDEGLRRLDVITFEPVGYLRYSADRRRYGGLSLLVTVSAGGDPGYGALVHIGKTGKIGYVYHREEQAGAKGRHGAVFSLDLYKWIGGVPRKLQDAKARVEAVRNAIR